MGGGEKWRGEKGVGGFRGGCRDIWGGFGGVCERLRGFGSTLEVFRVLNYACGCGCGEKKGREIRKMMGLVFCFAFLLWRRLNGGRYPFGIGSGHGSDLRTQALQLSMFNSFLIIGQFGFGSDKFCDVLGKKGSHKDYQ